TREVENDAARSGRANGKRRHAGSTRAPAGRGAARSRGHRGAENGTRALQGGLRSPPHRSASHCDRAGSRSQRIRHRLAAERTCDVPPSSRIRRGNGMAEHSRSTPATGRGPQEMTRYRETLTAAWDVGTLAESSTPSL